MGVNLIVYKVNNKDRVRAEGWDSIRYGGDKEYICADELPKEIIDIGDGYFDAELMWRPKDFEAHEKWVKANIHEFGQKRFLDIFERMKKEPDLWFHNSW